MPFQNSNCCSLRQYCTVHAFLHCSFAATESFSFPVLVGPYNSISCTSDEFATRGHSYDNDEAVVWRTERNGRIASCNVQVGCMVNQLLYPTFRGNAATRQGLKQCGCILNRGLPRPTVNIQCGLFVSTAHSWLTATPNGWVNDPEASSCNGLVEFKNPYSYRELSVSDVIVSNKCDCLVIEVGRIRLKHTHSYYYQVQMAMFCTNARWCKCQIITTKNYFQNSRVSRSLKGSVY